MGHDARPAVDDVVATKRVGGHRWARLGTGVAGLAVLVGVAACSPTPTATSTGYSSSTYGSTYGSSTYGSSPSGSSTYGSSTYGTSTSGYSSSNSSAYGAYGSSSGSSGSSAGSSSGSSSGDGYGGSYTNSDGQQVERPDSNSSGATAICKDGSDSHSKHKSGTCSGHGGVRQWL